MPCSLGEHVLTKKYRGSQVQYRDRVVVVPTLSEERWRWKALIKRNNISLVGFSYIGVASLVVDVKSSVSSRSINSSEQVPANVLTVDDLQCVV